MISKLIFNFFSLVVYILFANNFGQCIIVEISTGFIDGDVSYTIPKNKTYYFFRSIPYAKPPIGELRFQPPQSLETWEGVLSTKKDSPRCIQTYLQQIMGQEDCLYLNVYTPELPNNTQNLLPVLVWIHGGVFLYGSSEYNDAAPDYFLDQDIVFVSINYRLGILGFLSLNDLSAPGNIGLKDQNMALRWIRDNIENFGGDPNHVILFGQSAGAASVSYHIQSKLSEGLFSGAILDSGTSLCLWSLSRLGPQTAKEVAASFGIDTNTTQSILNGLRQIEAVELHERGLEVQTQILMANNPRDGFVFAPVEEPEHEGAFFTGLSHDILRSGRFFKVPVLVGYNSMEASIPFSDIFRLFLLKFDFNPSSLVPFDMNIKSSVVKDAIGKEIKFNYFGLIPIALSSNKVIEFISDDQFVRPIRQFARLCSRYTETYFYEFDYEGELGGFINRTMPGVAHSEELGYLFRRFRQANENDSMMRNMMVKLWTNFIKFRNPTPISEILFNNQTWLPISPTDEEINYFKINFKLQASSNPKKYVIDFWTDLYKKYGESPFDTY